MNDDSLIPEIGQAGVRYNAPPPEILPKVVGDIQSAVNAIGDADFALIGVADRKGGWNGAFVMKVPGPMGVGKMEVVTWVGKDWGTGSELDWGARLMWSGKIKNKE